MIRHRSKLNRFSSKSVSHRMQSVGDLLYRADATCRKESERAELESREADHASYRWHIDDRNRLRNHGVRPVSFLRLAAFVLRPLRPRDRAACREVAHRRCRSYCNHTWKSPAPILFGAASYFLEPYRRILLGVSGGMLLGLSLAALMGLDGRLGGFFGTILALICGLIGGFIVPRYFNSLIIAASAFGGAVLVMAGANLILPGVGLFDRAAGGVVPALITLALAIAGVSWQLSNIAKWVHPSAGHQGEALPR